MYRNTSAIIRPELMATVEEAAAADRYFIAGQVYPLYPSETKTGEYMKIAKASGGLLASEDKPGATDATRRAPKTAYKELDRTYEKDNYGCEDRGLQEPIDDSVQRELQRFFDAEKTVAKLVLRNMMIGHEIRVAGRVFNESIWGAATASKVAYTEALIETIDFPYDVEAAKEKVEKRGELCNTLILNHEVWGRARRSKLLREFLFGTQGGNKQITLRDIAEAFEIEKVLVAKASYSTAKKGKDVTDAKLSYIWGNGLMWVGCTLEGEFSAGGAGRTVVWQEDAAGLFVTETFRDENRRSDIVRVRQHTDEKEINLNCGTLIATQWA